MPGRFVSHAPPGGVIGYGAKDSVVTRFVLCPEHDLDRVRGRVTKYHVPHRALPDGVRCVSCGAVHMRTVDTGDYGWLYRDTLQLMRESIREQQREAHEHG